MTHAPAEPRSPELWRALVELTRRFMWATTTDEIVDALAEELKKLFGFPQVVIYFLEADQQPAYSVLWKARGDLPLVHKVPVDGDQILIEVFQAHEPIVVTDARTDPRTNKEVVETKGCRTLVFIPIILSDDPRGFVSTGTFGEQEWHADEAGLEYLSVLGRHLSLALDRLLISTEKETLTAELDHAQKMELLGRMAGSSAHELRNLLTAILGYTALLGEAAPEGVDGWEPAKIERAATCATEVVQSLLTFSRRRRTSDEVVDLNQLLTELEPMLASLTSRDVALTLALEEPLPRVRADRAELEQMLVHLVVNAAEAVEAGGEVEILTRNSGPRFAHEAPSSWVELLVKDNGPGLEEEVISKAFEPFFSTKNDPRNPGLGLSTCYGIVEQSEGHIWLDSEPKRGSTVHVLLPSHKTARSLPELPPSVLLVDPAPCGVELLGKLLRPLGLGYRLVETMEEARSALTPQICLVIAGAKFFEEAKDEELPVLFLSERPADAIPERQLLSYPFTSEELWHKVKALTHQVQPADAEKSYSKSLVWLSGRLLEAEDLSQVLAATRSVIECILDYASVWLYLREAPDSEVMELWEYRGEDSFVPLTIPVTGDRFLEEVFQMRGPVLVEDARVDPRTNKELVAATDCRSIAVIPFQLTDGRTGCLGTNTFGQNRRLLNQEEVAFLAALTGLTVVALERVNMLKNRRRIQRRFLRGQHLEAVSRLGRGLADDLRNSLTGIDGFTHLAQSSLDPKHPAQKLLSKIEENSRRAAQLVESLVAFSRTQTPPPANFDLNRLIHSLLPLLERLVGNVRLKVQTARQRCFIEFDWEQMEQVIMNLVFNARDALADSGEVRIRTHMNPPWVGLEVRDDGQGMEAEVAARAFEPFFSTKPDRRGAGLGLPTCRQVVEQAGGHIYLQTAPGVGTTVTIKLPAGEAPP